MKLSITLIHPAVTISTQLIWLIEHMILDYDTLIEALPSSTIYKLVRDCVFAMGDFSHASPQDLDAAISSTIQKIKAGKLLVEYGEDSETFALVDKNKLKSIVNNLNSG